MAALSASNASYASNGVAEVIWNPTRTGCRACRAQMRMCGYGFLDTPLGSFLYMDKGTTDEDEEGQHLLPRPCIF